MRTIESQLLDLIIDITEDRRKEYKKEFTDFLKDKDVDERIKTPFFLEGSVNYYINLRCSLLALGIESMLSENGHKNINSFRMLKSHGFSDKKEWNYSEKKGDSKIWTPVQRWIDKHDGKYDSLIISVCNRGRIKPRVRKSVIVYPVGLSSDNKIWRLLEDKKTNYKISIPQKRVSV